MNRSGRALMMICWGTIIGRLIWEGGFGWFVQQRMKIPLLIAAVALVAMGLYEALSAWREEEGDPHAHGRWRGPTVGWLLALPILVLVSVQPAALGAAAADRVDSFNPTNTGQQFDPLPDGSDPIEMRVFDFLDRAIWDEGRSLEGRAVRLEGLVVNDPDHPDGFTLTRFLVSCCAADGIPLQVDVHDVPGQYENDTWVRADVEWIPPDAAESDTSAEERRVAARLLSVTVVPDAVNDPYESPY